MMFLQHQIDTAIMRLREFEPEEGYYLAFSGGKDSIVIKQLAIESGVKFDAHYNDTTIDPPELRIFIKRLHSDVECHRPETPFLIEMVKRGFPMRQRRWCCALYKERGGVGRIVVTGVRWAESHNRSKRNSFESCYKEKKQYLHPIIDWSDDDVWNFIYDRELPYCLLYDEGYDRVGCVFCPMAYYKRRLKEAERYPKMAKAFERAFEKLYQNRLISNPDAVNRWASGKEMFWWWIGEGKAEKEPEDDDQIMMFE